MTSEVSAALRGTPDPDHARVALERIAASWPESQKSWREVLAGYGEMLPGLLHLLAISPISGTKILRDPDALVWLAAPAIRASDRGIRRMRGTLAELGWESPLRTGAPVKAETFTPLRQWKQRETLRIALRDVAGVAEVEETTQEISDLAEVCLGEITDAWHADHVRRFGDPGTPRVVLGMGKLGARELNFSSDIDVIFFYGEPGEMASGLSRQEFFMRCTQKVIETYAAAHPAGALFRIDLRLRPEGDGGPLVRSLDSMENHYAAFGETWERMALGKARRVAGDEELGYEFFQRMQAFIYPRAVGHEMIEEIAEIKGRIERELLGPARIHRDVKLGRGGIREVEFICQALQLLHGARHAFLQERQTLRALAALNRLGLLGANEACRLANAYRFLRRVEHRLQIPEEAQTHSLPENRDALRRLAQSLAATDGRPGSDEGDEGDAFVVALIRHMDAVRDEFERLTQARAIPELPPADLTFFHDPAAALMNLQDLGGGGGRARISPRTRKVFGRLEPLLLEWLQKIADPDAVLTRLTRFTERYGQRGALFEALLVNPRVLELFVKLFDASPWLSEVAIQRPQLVEEVARLGDLGSATTCAEHLHALARDDERVPWPARARLYRQAQLLRIGLRDLLGFASLPEVWRECSALAEACFLFAARELGCAEKLTIVAMGKFGGCELGYGADLDVLFIGDDSAAAAELTRAMSELTADGRLFSLDPRLRPEGESGPLAVTLESWKDYFARGRGELWEAQALTKARPIAGAQQAEWLAAAQTVWRDYGNRPDARDSIRVMLRRIAEHRGGDPMLDFKTGPGGLMQLEFYTQALQLERGMWEPNTIAALSAVAPVEIARPLTEAYLFLRRIETVLRRMHDTPVSRIPTDPIEEGRLAKRCSFTDADGFRKAAQGARGVISAHARL